jgi:tripartite-type tricarboxylate transporter receptor subunit TctC
MELLRRQFLHLAAGAAALPVASGIANAQAYPTRPVRFIVPLPAGGGLDFAARLIGEYLSRTLGQQVVVENKAGAGGMIGIETAAKSPPDGYSILVTTEIVASAPHVLRVNVDYVKGLVPVIELINQPVLLAVHPSLGVTSLAELIRAAKERSGLGFGTTGVGTQQHFVGEWFAKLAGLKLEHIPYRGAPQMVNDLVAGHILTCFLGPPALIPHYRSGALRLLAQSTERRSPSLPEVPTFHEAGVNGLVLVSRFGVFLPAGAPPTIVTQLNAEINKSLADSTIRESMLKASQEPIGGSAEQLSRVMRDDSEKYARLAKELNIKVD